jgi:hypothetical protein
MAGQLDLDFIDGENWLDQLMSGFEPQSPTAADQPLSLPPPTALLPSPTAGQPLSPVPSPPPQSLVGPYVMSSSLSPMKSVQQPKAVVPDSPLWRRLCGEVEPSSAAQAAAAEADLEPPAKKHKKTRNVRPKNNWGWDDEVTMFTSHHTKDDKMRQWTLVEVKSSMASWIDKNGLVTTPSNNNVVRWVRKIMDVKQGGWFDPNTVEINKKSSPTKYYAPKKGLCSGYEVSGCPLMEINDDQNKMRLSPLFIECLKNKGWTPTPEAPAHIAMM